LSFSCPVVPEDQVAISGVVIADVFAFNAKALSISVFVYVVCIALFIALVICVAAPPYIELAVKLPQFKSN
jgi:hypothetical protein